jgi:hypothetical protein
MAPQDLIEGSRESVASSPPKLHMPEDEVRSTGSKHMGREILVGDRISPFV